MRNILLSLLVLSQVALGETIPLGPGIAQSWRTQTYHEPIVIVTTQPSWCPACQLYEPVVKEVARTTGVRVYVNTDYRILGGPGYIPWTLVYTGTKTCDRELEGYATEFELRTAIKQSKECLQGTGTKEKP